MSRPAVDVVVPFVGSREARNTLVERMQRLHLAAADTLTIVDNGRTPAAVAESEGRARVLLAGAEQSSYYARNRGAEGGRGEWILFLDDDVEPSGDLIERYFDEPPGERTGVVAGGVEDSPLGPDPTLAERFAAQSQQMGQQNTLAGEWPYAQTANALVRRTAFDEAGGFTEGIRSGGDADLCFRLRAAGWELESRPAARVLHHNRSRTRALLRQKARHGAGAAWLDSRHPGSAPRREHPVSAVKGLAHALLSSVGPWLRRDHDRLAQTLVAPAAYWATEIGRLFSNDAPRR